MFQIVTGSREVGPFFVAKSNRADGQCDDIVGGHGLFLEERLAVFGADELAVVASQQIHAVIKFVDREEDALLAFAFGGAKLGAVGEDGFATLRILFGDVHDEGGRHPFEGSGIENFEWAVRFTGERKLFESGEEATFVAERGSVIVVWMTRFPVRKDYRVGAQIADHLREAHLVLAGGLHIGIRDSQISTPRNFQDFGGERRFFRAGFRSAARAHFSGSEIENAGLVSFFSHFDQGTATSEFDVVGVRGDGENVEFHGDASDESPEL
jgi:hypothetical protein